MPEIEFVRIKDPATGAEFTYDTAKVVALGLEEHVIDKDAFGPDGLPAPTKPYLPLGETLPGSAAERRQAKARAGTVADLRAEIEKRNEGRDEDALIVPDAHGNKPELVAALEADDAAAAEAEAGAGAGAEKTTEAPSPGEDAGQTSATDKEN